MFQVLGDKGRSGVADWLDVIHSLAPRARLQHVISVTTTEESVTWIIKCQDL
jgi:hypothetical protein